VIESGGESRLFFIDITQQVLVNRKTPILDRAHAKEDDRTGKKTQRFDVKKYKIFRFMESCNPENTRMGSCMAATD
jgi:hypothetical protein